MKIHKEGYQIILWTFIVLAIIATASTLLLSELLILKYGILLVCAGLFIFIVRFFRYPQRKISLGSENILCPADGKVVAIEEVEEKEFFKEKRRQVSVFMSPNNVHVNFFPIAGKVVYSKYHPGKYLVAWHPKSSEENERTTVVIQGENNHAILMRQIAGAVARRIVCYAKENQTAAQGGEMGFIKFGSRVDLFLPLDAKVEVKIGQKVIGRTTIIARF
ncbi:MAG: phosphatidylserine decarboxylase family protein [Bacteroidota bacterium]|nr:phosphatidylserine decarboxylase family protein [Bacillota bacterium]MDP4289921.1 phosphatidylserine decarboxylase family protein [Bacteroidota bacterium]